MTETAFGSRCQNIEQSLDEPRVTSKVIPSRDGLTQRRSQNKIERSAPADISVRERLRAAVGPARWSELVASLGAAALERLIDETWQDGAERLIAALNGSDWDSVLSWLQLNARDRDREGAGYSLVGWRKKYDRAPHWAVKNWRAEIKARKAAGCPYDTRRALGVEGMSDVNCLVEDFHPGPRKGTRATTEAENKARQISRLKEAWKGFHPSWVADRANTVVSDLRPVDRVDPHSQNAVRGGLSVEQQRTWEVYRKLVRRGSRSTGLRKRGPSREAIALENWASRNRKSALVLSLFIGQAEPIGYVARECGLPSIRAVVKAIAPALDSLRTALLRCKNSSSATLSVQGRPLGRI